ncbi:MAG TPA: hypothetical protein IAB56_06000 [Candidatus Scybalousia intestinigallinarum]|nr:hypothetical protein [Candidatus Scybalousia intestinigallinarum]
MGKKLLLVLFSGVVLLGVTGCGETNSTPKEYSEDIKEVRSGTVLLLGDYTFGEYLDYMLEDYSWTETDNYRGDLGTGAVIVKGKDKKTGIDIEILFVKEVTASAALSNVEYLKCNGDDLDKGVTCDGREYSYQTFLNYLYDYKDEVEEYYENSTSSEE